MVLGKLGTSLKATLAKISGATHVDEALINQLVKDIQRALLQADVNVKLVFALTNTIRERIKTEDTPAGLTKKEFLVHIVYDELVQFLGGDKTEIKLVHKPTVIMLVGLFGSGKTTTAGKLAKYYQKRGKKVGAVSLDVWRPAAAEQLKQLSQQINVPYFIKPEEKDPVAIFNHFKPEFEKLDILIVDTAGRDAFNEELIDEINKINSTVHAHETLLVISADIGQAAQDLASKFHELCHVTGVVATKMDGTAKAGGALSACAVTEAPIKFIGVGEKIDDLEHFNPKGFVGQLLGMGDLEGLLEKAQLAISEEDAKDMGRRLMSGEYNLVDLYDQMQAMNNMGSFGKLIEMIPGMGKLQLPKEALQVQEDKLKVWKFVMDSCTKYELEHPDEISSDRVDRITQGSGRKEKEVRELLKHFKQSKKMFKMFKGGDPEKMMADMQSGKMNSKTLKMFKKMQGKRGMKGFKF